MKEPVFLPFYDTAMLTISATTNMCEAMGPLLHSLIVDESRLIEIYRDFFASSEEQRYQLRK